MQGTGIWIHGVYAAAVRACYREERADRHELLNRTITVERMTAIVVHTTHSGEPALAVDQNWVQQLGNSGSSDTSKNLPYAHVTLRFDASGEHRCELRRQPVGESDGSVAMVAHNVHCLLPGAVTAALTKMLSDEPPSQEAVLQAVLV